MNITSDNDKISDYERLIDNWDIIKNHFEKPKIIKEKKFKYKFKKNKKDNKHILKGISGTCFDITDDDKEIEDIFYTSASNSIITLTHLNDIPLIIKYYYSQKYSYPDISENPAYIEINIMKRARDLLIKNNGVRATQNIIFLYSDGQCDNFFDINFQKFILNKLSGQKKINHANILNRSDDYTSVAQVAITEYIEGGTFLDYLKSKDTINSGELKGYMLQLFITLFIMQKDINFSHNDFHLENILMKNDNSLKNGYYIYSLNNVSYNVHKQSFIPIIIDFDKSSYIDSSDSNVYIQDFGDKRFYLDHYKFMASVYIFYLLNFEEVDLDVPIIRWLKDKIPIEMIVPEEDINYDLNQPDYMIVNEHIEYKGKDLIDIFYWASAYIDKYIEMDVNNLVSIREIIDDLHVLDVEEDIVTEIKDGKKYISLIERFKYTFE